MLKKFVAASFILSLFSSATFAHKKHENENQTQEVTIKTQKITDRLFHQTLVETTDIVRKGMTAGKTLEGLKKDGLPEKYKLWGTGFVKTDFWIKTVYKSLSAKK